MKRIISAALLLAMLVLCAFLASCSAPITPAQQAAINKAEIIGVNAGLSKLGGESNTQIERDAAKAALNGILPKP